MHANISLHAMFATSMFTHTHTSVHISTYSEQGVKSYHSLWCCYNIGKNQISKMRACEQDMSPAFLSPYLPPHLVVYIPSNHQAINTALKTCIKDREESERKQHPKSQR